MLIFAQPVQSLIKDVFKFPRFQPRWRSAASGKSFLRPLYLHNGVLPAVRIVLYTPWKPALQISRHPPLFTTCVVSGRTLTYTKSQPTRQQANGPFSQGLSRLGVRVQPTGKRETKWQESLRSADHADFKSMVHVGGMRRGGS